MQFPRPTSKTSQENSLFQKFIITFIPNPNQILPTPHPTTQVQRNSIHQQIFIPSNSLKERVLHTSKERIFGPFPSIIYQKITSHPTFPCSNPMKIQRVVHAPRHRMVSVSLRTEIQIYIHVFLCVCVNYWKIRFHF